MRTRLLWLLGLAKPYWRGVCASVLLQVLTVFAGVGLMATSAWLISKAALQPSIADLGIAPVAVRFFGISRAVFRYLERLVTHNLTFRLLARLRVWFYTAIEPLAPARLMQYRSGDLLGRVVADINTLENVYARVVAPPVTALIVAGGITALFYTFTPAAALVLLAFLAFTGTALPWWTWRGGKTLGPRLIATRAEANALLVDMLQGLTDSAAYGHTGTQLQALDRLNREIVTHEQRMARQAGAEVALSTLLVNLGALAVLVVAIPRVDGLYLATLTLGTLAAFEAVTPLSVAMQHLGANLAAAARLQEIVHAAPAVTDPPVPSPSPRACTLDIRDLVFRYAPQEPPVFDGLTLSVREGERITIVGASGAGKSTLTHLLLRFWEYDSGEIRLGGHDLRAYCLADIYAHFGVMSQRTHLFNTTIRENIAIARPGASQEDILHAARQAQIHDFILSLPDGYATFVGENGVALSGGERQRIALARVLLKDAPVVILDEATANLDSVTERALLQAIFEVTQQRTLILITHRLALLEQVDRVFVLNQGRVVESGTHAQLLRGKGVYWQTWRKNNRSVTS